MADHIDTHVETLVGLRVPELRQANATLLVKLERVTAERDEALRLLRAAATTPQCMECIEERGDARLATYVHEDVSGAHVDVARYYCDGCAVRHEDAEEATFSADVRRISELLKETSDG